MAERKVCIRCGREGSLKFEQTPDGWACAAVDACRERIASAERNRSIYRSEGRDRYGQPSHQYRLDGERVPGVTTLLGEGMPKPALIGWAGKTVARYAAQHLDEIWAMRSMGEEAVFQALRHEPFTQRDAKAVRGTKVHGYAERLARDEPVEVPEDHMPYVEAYLDFMDDWQPRSLYQELAIGNKRWRYGGTLDDISRFPRLPESDLPIRCSKAGCDHLTRMVDYKTSGGIYSETALQVAGYANPENVFKDPGTGQERTIGELGICDEGYVLHITPEGYRVRPVYCGPEAQQAFVRVAWLARFRAKDGQLNSWLGEPLSPPTMRSGA